MKMWENEGTENKCNSLITQSELATVLHCSNVSLSSLFIKKTAKNWNEHQ
jgi:hypothetical protein